MAAGRGISGCRGRHRGKRWARAADHFLPGSGIGAQHRLFCLLENGTEAQLAARGFDQPQLVVVNGMVKPNVTLFSEREYVKHVRALGDDYRSTLPRRVAS